MYNPHPFNCPLEKIILSGDRNSSLLLCFCPDLDPAPHYMILANRHDISRLDLNTKNHTFLNNGLKNTIGLDFHFRKGLIFWSDLIEDKIYRGQLTGSGKYIVNGDQNGFFHFH